MNHICTVPTFMLPVFDFLMKIASTNFCCCFWTVFNYEEHVHSVMRVNSTAYEDCIKDPYISLFASGSDSVVLSEVGRSWYICGVGDHCENGQKLSINVVP